MEQIFYWALGISVVLLGICSIFLLISERTKRKNAAEAFEKAGAVKTTQIGDLWLDEDRMLWLVAREGGETPVHSYDDILGASLSEDGTQYIWKKGEIRAVEGNAEWPLVPDERGRYSAKKRVTTIYLNIFVKKRECPVETLVLLGRSCSRSSKAYREAAAQAAALMRVFNTVNEKPAKNAKK